MLAFHFLLLFLTLASFQLFLQPHHQPHCILHCPPSYAIHLTASPSLFPHPSPPSAICHNAGKEDHVEEEACEPGTACSITTSASIYIKNGSHIMPPPPATEESIMRLTALTMLLPDLPLCLVWKHAFEQGSQEGADQEQIVGILAEREEWEVEGHRQWCFDKLLTCFSCDIGLPEEHTCTGNKLDAMVQASPSHHTSSSQTTSPCQC